MLENQLNRRVTLEARCISGLLVTQRRLMRRTVESGKDLTVLDESQCSLPVTGSG